MKMNENITTLQEVVSCFPARKQDSHKGDYGKALLIVGSYGMCGAAVMAAAACARSGAGLIRVAVPQCIYPIAAPALPDAVFLPLQQNEQGSISASQMKELIAAAEQSDAVLFGCGCRNNIDTEMLVRALCAQELRLILDADGINALHRDINVLRDSSADLILTPHVGEFSRLTGCSAEKIAENRVRLAGEFAVQNQVVLVLKGYHTVIAAPDGRIRINPTGNPGMARGGSGDVLAGILTALVAQGIPSFEAAVSAVYLHGMAGDLAAQRRSQQAMLASDLIDSLCEVFLKIESER